MAQLTAAPAQAAFTALEVIPPIKQAIAWKAETYGPLYLLALIASIVLFFYSGWARWVALGFVFASLASAWSMRSILVQLRRIDEAFAQFDHVVRVHQKLNAIALALLAYALAAVYASWPGPSLALLLANAINMAHYAGYRRALRSN